MNISSGWRDRRTFMPPLYYPYANYSTDSKNTMSKTFAEEMFLNNFHLGPDPLRKNLADTIVTQEKMAPKNNKNKLEKEDLRVEEDSQVHVDASRLSGLSNFFSGVLNVISNAVFSKRKPDYSSNSGQNMALPSMWQDAKLSDENKNVQAVNPSDDISSISSEFFVSDMSDCRSAVAHCQSKLDQVRSLLGADKPSQCSLRVRRRPKKVFVEPSHVEDCFEDAFSPEDFENLANNSFIEYYSPVCYHDQTYHELDSPKCKIEEPVTPTVAPETPVAKSSEVSDSPNVLPEKYTVETDIPNVMQVLKLVPENTEVGNEHPKMGSENPTITNNVPETITTSNMLQDEPKKKVVDSCEDKMNKLKLLLQGRCKKPKIEKQEEIEPVTTYPTLMLDPEPQPLIKLPPRPKPSTNVKDKRFKNPNRSCDKRRKSRMKKSIEDDLMFANEIGSEDLSSSIENSPSTNNMEIYVGSRVKHIQNTESKPAQPKPVPRKDFFDEVAGCFQAGSVESDDSFQIVFHDSPRGRRSSDCDSEDSFIVFEDSPDSCYTSNDVFGDSDDESSDGEYDSDSDASDSGCGVFNLSGSLSKSVHNLADDSLYVDYSEDEVDCANVEDLTICDSVAASDIDDAGVSKGLLLDDRKKSLRKNLPAKKVHFSSDPPKVHVMRVWLYAAKQTRCRYWQQFAVDRERFKRRIADVDMAVSWVLKPQHRSRVMFQRFMPWWNAQKRKEIAEKKEKEAQEKLEEEERLKNEEMKKNTELHKEKLEGHSNLDGDNTNTDNCKPEELEENLDNNDSYKTLINTVDNSELDARNSVNSDTTMEENDNLNIKEVDCKNSTNFKSGSMENEKYTKKDLNGKMYSNEIVPFSDKKLDTDYVSLRTEFVKMNT